MIMRQAGSVRRALAITLMMLLLPLGAGAAVQSAAPGTQLRDVRVTTQPDSVTILVKTTGEVKYQADLVESPYRLVLDFEDTSYGWRKTPLAVEAEPVKQIRGSQYRRGVARVVLELTRKVGYAIREEDDGLAIVIPTAATPGPSQASRPAPLTPAAPGAKAPTVKTPSEDPAAQPTPTTGAAVEGKRPVEPTRVAQTPAAPAPTAPIPPAPATPPPPPAATPPAAKPAPNGSRLI